MLTHGLPSIGNEHLSAVWPAELDQLAWVDRGEICIGTMAEYLCFRPRGEELLRIDCDLLQRAKTQKLSGALTASGTMAVCAELGLALAVTCGMGGIGQICGEELCPDLPALAQLPVALIATSPKDMLDIPATLDWLAEHGVTVLIHSGDRCSGYLFHSTDYPLEQAEENLPAPQTLLLNPIPEVRRLADPDLLRQGIAAGKAAEAAGRYYHPAVNGELDRLSKGQAAAIQLDSLIANGLWAQKLTCGL